jgi:hypothetical protein
MIWQIAFTVTTTAILIVVANSRSYREPYSKAYNLGERVASIALGCAVISSVVVLVAAIWEL